MSPGRTANLTKGSVILPRMSNEDAPRPSPDTPPKPAAPPPVVAPEDLRAVPWQKGPGGVREKRRRFGNTVYRLLHYPAGYQDAEPQERQQVGLVLAGRATVLVRNRSRPLRAGQSLIFPQGLPRKLKVGRRAFVLFLVETSKSRRRRRGRGGAKKANGAPPPA